MKGFLIALIILLVAVVINIVHDTQLPDVAPAHVIITDPAPAPVAPSKPNVEPFLRPIVPTEGVYQL